MLEVPVGPYKSSKRYKFREMDWKLDDDKKGEHTFVQLDNGMGLSVLRTILSLLRSAMDPIFPSTA